MRERLRFDKSVDSSAPGQASVRRLLLYAEAVFACEDGMASQLVALTAFTDLFLHTALHELPHNHRERLLRPARIATPKGHLWRAEASMRAQVDAPINMAQIAVAGRSAAKERWRQWRREMGSASWSGSLRPKRGNSGAAAAWETSRVQVARADASEGLDEPAGHAVV